MFTNDFNANANPACNLDLSGHMSTETIGDLVDLEHRHENAIDSHSGKNFGDWRTRIEAIDPNFEANVICLNVIGGEKIIEYEVMSYEDLTVAALGTLNKATVVSRGFFPCNTLG